MKIVNQSATLKDITHHADDLIVFAARECYQSNEHKALSDYDLVEILKQRHHHSVFEHAKATFHIICDRGVSHEIVRHRIASYSQESTRFCSYDKGKHGSQITLIKPPMKTPRAEEQWKLAMVRAENAYMDMRKNKVAPEIARSVLPNSLKTSIVMTANFREWMHVIKLRSSRNKAAHPQIKEVFDIVQGILEAKCPQLFSHEALDLFEAKV